MFGDPKAEAKHETGETKWMGGGLDFRLILYRGFRFYV